MDHDHAIRTVVSLWLVLVSVLICLFFTRHRSNEYWRGLITGSGFSILVIGIVGYIFTMYV